MRKYLLNAFLVLLLANSCQVETARMSDYEVQGIDISHHQSFLNWDTIKAQDIDFAFVKATEADNFVDSLFAYNWNEMRRVQIKRGAYHFFRPNVSVTEQVNNFIANVCIEEGDLPPVLDIERLDGVAPALVAKRANEWLKAIRIHYNIQPIVYTNLTFYNEHLYGSIDDVTLWIARYNAQMPLLRKNNWDFWQYGNKGKLQGIDGFVDFNVYKGSMEELEHICFQPTYSYSYNAIDLCTTTLQFPFE